MIPKEKIKVGLRFAFGDGVYVYCIEEISQDGTVLIRCAKTPHDNLGYTIRYAMENLTIQNAKIINETPEQKGKRETDYADKVIQDIEQFELDNIEYLRDQIQEKINRIR